MTQKRILSVQDISCLGKCSNTAALPILSAAGCEAVMLPTALLSTHTGGFTDYYFRDLTADMEGILHHFEQLGLSFDAVLTGYFGSARQIDLLSGFLKRCPAPDRRLYVDPVMGDNGVLYSIYDNAFVSRMRAFCVGTQLLTPNVTEACLLAGIPFTDSAYTPEKAAALMGYFSRTGVRQAVITGWTFPEEKIGVCVTDFTENIAFTVTSERLDGMFHGAGDSFMAALCAGRERGLPLKAAVETAVAFTYRALRPVTASGKWYGPLFEPELSWLCRQLDDRASL